jgi:hypothetical protein
LFRDSSEPTCTRKRLYQFTAIDDRTRLRVLKVYEACTQGTAIRFLDGMLRRLPFRVQVVQTDNGAEFQSHSDTFFAITEKPSRLETQTDSSRFYLTQIPIDCSEHT